jgi:3-dehydroquinate synthetase/shikimate kinase
VHALGRHLALIGFMGAGKSTAGHAVATRLGRPFLDLDREIEARAGMPITRIFEEQGEPAFRALEADVTVEVLQRAEPHVLALGGGAVTSKEIRTALRERALTVLLEVSLRDAWRRSQSGTRPLARDRDRFELLFEERQGLYRDCADTTARDAHDVVLAAGGVHCSVGALERLGELVPGVGPVSLVGDRRVLGIYGADAQLALGTRLGATHELPSGEEAKSGASLESLWGELRLDRKGTLVALGGGCTTDVAGFAAATYMRGIPWVAVPTTLVGQVDAAIGGKTAINLPSAKNLIGSFHWPARTIIDPVLLETLPEAERWGGMAEVVKTGLLAGERLWELPDPELVRRCAAHKVAVCLRDPHDRAIRTSLNLGHTFAHALEAAAAYSTVTHGHAVALGLRAALQLSVRHLGLDPAVPQLVEDVLRPKPVTVDVERAWQAMARDKKSEGGKTKLVLLERLGKPVWGVELPDDEVRAALESLVAR